MTSVQGTPSMQGTPSSNKGASRSQSGDIRNLPSELRQDLALDVRRSQNADFDDVLKFNLFLVMQESQAKQDLVDIQENIEELERSIDDTTRANRVADQHPPGDNDQGPDESNKLTQWKNRRDELVKTRQGKLDGLLSASLKEVLPICNDNELLREYLSKYSEANTEDQMYSPFVQLCNHALDSLASLELDTFRPIDRLNCRLQVNDTKPIITNYNQAQPVYSKPDVVITSAVAAMDVAHDGNTASKATNGVFDKPPKEAFKMRQVLCCGEFKFKKTNINDKDSDKSKHSSLTPVSSNYDEKRKSQHRWFDEALSETYPIDKSAHRLTVINSEAPTEVEGPPVKRKKTNTSEPVIPSSGTRGESSKATGSKSGSASKAASSRSKYRQEQDRSSGMKGSRGPNLGTLSVPISKSQSMTDARTQCAQYGMEMLSYSTGVHRAITFLIYNCKLWVWYYDRQGVIQSDGIDFVQDLPRFLVLLFTFQRFGLADWGTIPELNPGAVLAHNDTPEQRSHSRGVTSASDNRRQRMNNVSTCILKISDLDPDSCPDPQTGEQIEEIKIQTDDWLSHQPHCLAGRATAVLGSSAHDDATNGELACKISFPEVARQNEAKTIELLRKHIESDAKTESLSKHLPVVVIYGDMARYGTQRIRSVMRLATDGSRTLRVMVSERRVAITTLAGAEFVKAWLEAVGFHAYLWAIGLEHGDPSLWNVMYNDKKGCAVLSDYDLSIFRDGPRVPGTDRTGTIPFMAIDLLTDEYWRGQIARAYRHELEAFIWILPFVFLRYQENKPQRDTPVDSWMTSDYNSCRRHKVDFIIPSNLHKMAALCKKDYIQHWLLVQRLLYWLTDLTTMSRDMFDKPSRMEKFDNVVEHWPRFVEVLKGVSATPSLEPKIANLVDELKLDTIVTSGLARPLTHSC